MGRSRQGAKAVALSLTWGSARGPQSGHSQQVGRWGLRGSPSRAHVAGTKPCSRHCSQPGDSWTPGPGSPSQSSQHVRLPGHQLPSISGNFLRPKVAGPTLRLHGCFKNLRANCHQNKSDSLGSLTEGGLQGPRESVTSSTFRESVLITKAI